MYPYYPTTPRPAMSTPSPISSITKPHKPIIRQLKPRRLLLHKEMRTGLRNHPVEIIDGARGDVQSPRLRVIHHTDTRSTLGTEPTRSEIARSPLCRCLVGPSDARRRKECPGLVGSAGLFAAGYAMAVC